MSSKQSNAPVKQAYIYQEAGPEFIAGAYRRKGDVFKLTEEHAKYLGNKVKLIKPAKDLAPSKGKSSD